MLFSRFTFNHYFDLESIRQLYKNLSEKFPGLELIWYEGRKSTDNPDLADRATIKKDGKSLFTIISRNNQAVIVMKQTNGKESEVLKSLKECGFEVEEPSSGTAILCTVIFIALITFLMTLHSDIIFIILPFPLLLFTGIGLHSTGSKKMKNSEYSLTTAGSIITLIGLFGMAPSSLLTFPLVKYINQKALYEVMENL